MHFLEGVIAPAYTVIQRFFIVHFVKRFYDLRVRHRILLRLYVQVRRRASKVLQEDLFEGRVIHWIAQ